MVILTATTVVYNLAIAIICGVVVSVPAYAWNNAILITGNVVIDENSNTIYYIQGLLFFGSVQGFSEIFTWKVILTL